MSNRTISMKKHIGDFAENKDTAKSLRIMIIMPALQNNHDVTFDFAGVDGATQSFVHALISEPIREFYGTVFDKLHFKNCNATIRAVVEVVYEYMQEGLEQN